MKDEKDGKSVAREMVQRKLHEALVALETWTLAEPQKQTYSSLNELHKKIHAALEMGCRYDD